LRSDTMSYHDISLISILCLHGTLHVQKAGNAEGVSVQTEGPYEAKVVDGSWLMIYPEGQEPQFPHEFHTDLTAGRSNLGSADVSIHGVPGTGSADGGEWR
jgi:hypothetical protein